MPRILLKERGAFENTDTGGAWLSSARAHKVWTAGDKSEEGEDDVKSSCPLCPGRHTCYSGWDKGSRSRVGDHTTVNSFQVHVHTARHTMGAGHARSSYLNRKEGDAEGRASDWSEVITRALSHMYSSMCSSAPDPEMWIIQGTLENRWGDSGEIQLSIHSWDLGSPGEGGAPRLLSSRESIHLLSVYGQLSLEHRFRFGLNGKIKWST
ncbi:PREDICTED: uncharacterized protein LOC109222929 [Nicotiana attenuata]|uniref:uncharacterized protein LOC109222929 n=1 Tax=Nicotiana attenuata TaxID=49451 RepID=UPI00090506A6|nr:PREDICTED: uncharacterized protein LOC109222929 [Nicotiana attenuata]